MHLEELSCVTCRHKIAKRYDEYKLNKKHEFISIVLDEVGLFAYGGVLEYHPHRAPGKREFHLLFPEHFRSLPERWDRHSQTILRLRPTANLSLRISNEDTAEQFIAASGTVRTERVSYQVEKPIQFDGIGGYEDVGRGTRQETFESRVKDHHLKVLPTGQMMAPPSRSEDGSSSSSTFMCAGRSNTSCMIYSPLHGFTST